MLDKVNDTKSLCESRLRATDPVWLGDGWKKTPRYHLWGSPGKSACGLDLHELRDAIRLDWAEQFGVCCATCLKRRGV